MLQELIGLIGFALFWLVIAAPLCIGAVVLMRIFGDEDGL